MTIHNENKDTTVNRIRQAIGGIQANFAATPTILLDATPTKPSDAVATLQAAIDAIDKTAIAEAAFHAAVAAQQGPAAEGGDQGDRPRDADHAREACMRPRRNEVTVRA